MSVFEKILKYNAGRDPKLVKLKFKRMAAGAFPFFRGTDHLFGDSWAELAPPDQGPDLLISGDLHVENFGAFQTGSGEWRFDVNDFDEAIVAPCGLVVVRCASSILLAAEEWALTPVAAANLVLVFLGHYRKTVLHGLKHDKIGFVKNSDEGDPVSKGLASAKRATQRRLIPDYTRLQRDGTRAIKRDPHRPKLDQAVYDAVSQAVQEYAAKTLQQDEFHILDATGRIAGIGSLGVRRFVILVGNGNSVGNERLYDVKQCTAPALRSCSRAKQPDHWGNDALRVVESQTHLQGEPAIGLDSLTWEKDSYRIRILIPEEDRCQIDRFREKASKLSNALEVIGQVVGWSHLRGARFGDFDCRNELGIWASGSALDAVLKSAVQYAYRTISDFHKFQSDYRKWKSRKVD